MIRPHPNQEGEVVMMFNPCGELKSKNLNSYGKLVHNMCIHSFLLKASTFEKVTDQDLLDMYHLWTKKILSLSFLILTHLMATVEPSKSTSCLPYGMAMTKIFRYCKVPLKEEGFTKERSYFGVKNLN